MKARTKYLVASLVLHLLLLLFFVGVVRFQLFAQETDLAEKLNSNPIVFELQESDKPKQVVETPDDAEAEELQEKTNLVSDKNARAQNLEPKPELDLGEAFAKGDFEFRELPTNGAPPGSPGQLAEDASQAAEQKTKTDEQKIDEADYQVVDNSAKFSREFLTRQSTQDPGASRNTPKAHFDNQDSYVLNTGSFSFNTYDWEYAPYMLALKKRVESNIFPPSAYYRLAIIEGVTKIRFRIYPDGTMSHLQVLDYVGHQTLMETSVRALEISSPFQALPEHFPEEYLEVTGTFLYPNLKTRSFRKG